MKLFLPVGPVSLCLNSDANYIRLADFSLSIVTW